MRCHRTRTQRKEFGRADFIRPSNLHNQTRAKSLKGLGSSNHWQLENDRSREGLFAAFDDHAGSMAPAPSPGTFFEGD